MLDQLKYPVGQFSYAPNNSIEEFERWKHTILEFPNEVSRILTIMNDVQLDSTYRPGGWTGRQVVHHVADSHSHALLRFKTSLTEDKPTIKPYLEAEYAKLSDYKLPLESALSILNGVHIKWFHILNELKTNDWGKGYFHPESGKFFTLHNALALYAWHCNHHLGHLKICANIK